MTDFESKRKSALQLKRSRVKQAVISWKDWELKLTHALPSISRSLTISRQKNPGGVKEHLLLSLTENNPIPEQKSLVQIR